MERDEKSGRNLQGKRLLVVGGVAGGASCAARARRLSEDLEIIIFERGPYVSFANCGLPYYVGDVITEEKDLLVATPQLFRNRFNIEVRLQNEVRMIDTDNNEIEIRNIASGELYRERYDYLVLAPGASPIKPPLTGIDLPGLHTLRTIPDSRQIKDWIVERDVKEAVIVGGGFIGLEMAENLSKRGISITLIEMANQVMPSFDPEMVVPLQDHLEANGVNLCLGDAVAAFTQQEDGKTIMVSTKSGRTFSADMVLLAIGVRPEISLAKQAGIELGGLGGIRVDEHMRTSHTNIYAVGDAVEVRDFVTGQWTLIPLAGPANRQGRIAADGICGRDSAFRGIQATAVCRVFNMTMASTGVSEKMLMRIDADRWANDYDKVYLHPGHHVRYYPGAKPMTIKLIFSKHDGKIMGAQAVGEEGVDKRIDVLAMAIQKGATVYDLEEAELCYAPQFGAAKDPVNIAGMIASNALRGDAAVAHWESIDPSSSFVLDVREPAEYMAGYYEGALNIPLGKLRDKMKELPKNKEIIAYCAVGQRSYYASRALQLHGFKARNLSGGMRTYLSQRRVQKPDSHL